MHQAVVEVGTDICADVDEAFLDVANLRSTIAGIAGSLGFAMGSSGTHPFSHWESQLITDHVRYSEIVNELQEAARSNLLSLACMYMWVWKAVKWQSYRHSPVFSAPYLCPQHQFTILGRKISGYKSFRTKVFDKFPRTGIPDNFESIEAYENYVKLLVKTNCIDNAKKIWWDLRVHQWSSVFVMCR